MHLIPIAITCWLWLTLGAWADTITASGSGLDRQAAIHQALRSAVEQAAGVLMTSESLAIDGALVEDKIYAVAQSFVRDFSVIRERPTSHGGVEVVVLAEVNKNDLEARLLPLAGGRVEGGKLAAILDTRDTNTRAKYNSMVTWFKTRTVVDLLDDVVITPLGTRQRGDRLLLGYRVHYRFNPDFYRGLEKIIGDTRNWTTTPLWNLHLRVRAYDVDLVMLDGTGRVLGREQVVPWALMAGERGYGALWRQVSQAMHGGTFDDVGFGPMCTAFPAVAVGVGTRTRDIAVSIRRQDLAEVSGYALAWGESSR